MRKIAILNFKGGTGKTTTAVNLSHALALKRQSVLVIDCDPQGSVASWLGINLNKTFFDLFTDKTTVKTCIYHIRKGFDVIPSDKRLALIEIRLAKEKDMEKAFKKRLGSLRGYGVYLNI